MKTLPVPAFFSCNRAGAPERKEGRARKRSELRAINEENEERDSPASFF
jgi:hypothetical protein